MLKIAITGNIASGKTLFEDFLKSKGFSVLCLDFVTASLYESSKPLQEFLLKKFNTISRVEISKNIFKNPFLKQELEDFIYPLILNQMEKFLRLRMNAASENLLLIFIWQRGKGLVEHSLLPPLS